MRNSRPALLAITLLGILVLLGGARAASASPITFYVSGNFSYGCGFSGCMQGVLSGFYTFDSAGPAIVGPWSFNASDEDGGPASGDGMGNPADGNPYSPCAATGTCRSFVVLNGNQAHFSQGVDSAFGFVDGWVDLSLGPGPGTGSFFDIAAPAPSGWGNGPYSYNFDYVATPVPEPASILLLLTGLALLGWFARRRGASEA